MKYLLQAISSRRTDVHLTDPDLRQLLTEVRKGRDEREEFLESIERIITDLRGYNEHSAPFLARVSKRDAPDYYDFIKTPMDLGTMSKKLRAGQYRNKRQFADDLDLIWENCLVYNSDPAHPLRRNVQFMRKKANHLLEFVSDKSDVKDALSQWEAAEEAAAAAAAANGGAAPGTTPTTFSSPNLAGLTPFSRRPTSLTISLGRKAKRRAFGSEQDGDAEGDGDVDAGLPFDQRPALLRTPANMQTFNSLDSALAASWQEMSLSALEGDMRGVSESSATPRRIENGLRAEAPGMLQTLSTFGVADPVRTALTSSSASLPTATPSTPAPRAITFLEPHWPSASTSTLVESPPLNWWAALSHESLAANGLPALPHSTTNPVQPPKRRRAAALAKGKAAAVEDSSTLTAKPATSKPTGPFAPAEQPAAGSSGLTFRSPDLPPRLRKARQRAGYAGLVTENVRTVRRLRKTHVKFVELAHAASALQNGDESMMQTIRAAIAESDSDSAKGEDEDETLVQESNVGRKKRQKKRARERKPSIWPLGRDELEMEEPREENPFVHLDPSDANAASSHVVNVLLAHSGFEASHASPASVLASVLIETLMNLGRTLRLYSDQYAHQMSSEEMILHALRENGHVGVAELETHVRDDVERYGVKMADLLRKMKGAYREEVRNQMERAAEEDEAGFVDGSEAFLSGAFASDMGDDFFGFREMGLEADLGVASLSVPARLLAGGRRNFVGGSAANGLRPGDPTADGPRLQYTPPPPFVPISAGAIACQIGLLQPWYRDKMRIRRARFRRAGLLDGANAIGTGVGANGAPPNGAMSETVSPHPNASGTDEQDAAAAAAAAAERAKRESAEADLELEDEEQERQKYRVPPNGKMPLRLFVGSKIAEAAAAAPAGVSGEGKTKGASTTAGAGANGTSTTKGAHGSAREGSTAGAGRGRGRGRGGSAGGGPSKKQRRESALGGAGAGK